MLCLLCTGQARKAPFPEHHLRFSGLVHGSLVFYCFITSLCANRAPRQLKSVHPLCEGKLAATEFLERSRLEMATSIKKVA